MKVIWYKQNDESWSARHYPRGIVASSVAPLQLLVRKDGNPRYPWYWEVTQHGTVICCGHADETDRARITAHNQMAQHLFLMYPR